MSATHVSALTIAGIQADLALAAHRVHDLSAVTAQQGTGCTLASTIAAQLCRGLSLSNGCEAGIEYVARGLHSGCQPGRSEVGVLDQFGVAR